VVSRSVVCVGTSVLAVVVAPLLHAGGNRVDNKCPRTNSALDILWVHEPVIATCTKTIKNGHHLTPTETVSVETNTTNGQSGALEFQTPHLATCIIQGKGSSDQLAPQNNVALRHVSGVTTCVRQPGDTWTIQVGPITVRGVKVGPFVVRGGDLLTLTAKPGHISVGVTHGTAQVDGLTVGVGDAWNWPAPSPPEAVTVFHPLLLQQQAIAEVKYNVLPASAPELSSYLAQNQQPVFLIGGDQGSLGQESQQLKNSGIEVVGALQTFDPQVIAVAYNQQLVLGRTPTVVVVGESTGQVSSVIQAVNATHGIGSGQSQSQAPAFWLQTAASTAAITTPNATATTTTGPTP
jgi:hypothetical protein